MSQSQVQLSTQIRAAFGWWQESGVDLDFADDVTDWLAKEAEHEAEKPKQIARKSAETADVLPVKKKADLLGENAPEDLASFREWWLSDPAIDPVGVRGRIAPRGLANAELMVVVMAPEETDTQMLLSGPQGKLFDGFLRAAGLDRDRIYLASALPRYYPVSDGNDLKSTGYGEVLIHHIKLAAPARLLVLGRNVLPLLGHETTQEPAHLQNIKHENHILPLMVVEGLASMLAMPRLKARFWRKWLDWTGG